MIWDEYNIPDLEIVWIPLEVNQSQSLLWVVIFDWYKKGHHTNVKELWAVDGLDIEITRASMSYKQFLFLTRCINFNDRKTRDERQKIDNL